ncbi:ribonuclease III [bacterium]|nr:ribonuclease III [bacterium]
MKEKNLLEIEKKLGLEFKNKNLLLQALCHRSYLNEHPEWKLGDNERLEFLGDAVIEILVTEYLFSKFPEEGEGFLTSLRSAVVNSQNLSSLAEKLELQKYLLLSKGEEKNTLQKSKQSILADAFEALVGAIYLDQGKEKAKKFLEKILFPTIEEILKNKNYKDPKTLFQEKAQAMLNLTPTYQILKEWGPDHNKTFEAGVFLKGKLIAKGIGSSKQEAETNAAKKALQKTGWEYL